MSSSNRGHHGAAVGIVLVLLSIIGVQWRTSSSAPQQPSPPPQAEDTGSAASISSMVGNSVGIETASPVATQSRGGSLQSSHAILHPRAFPSLSTTRAGRKVPPLLRLQGSTTSAIRTSSGKVSNPNRSIIEDAYRGEYGWRFKEYISSKLEDDFYADVTPYINDMHWPELTKKYHARVEALLRVTKGRVALNENLVDDATHQLLERCDREDEHHDGSSESIAQLARRFAESAKSSCFGERPSTTRTENDDDPATLGEYLSRFVYEFVCLGDPCDVASFPTESGWVLGETHTSLIEPLFATMRHPKFFLTEGTREFLEDKEYMMVDKWALQNLHTRWKKRVKKLRDDGHAVAARAGGSELTTMLNEQKSIFVDMGASVYFRGQGGASQKWFVGLTDCLCVPFTDMFLFEAKHRAPPLVWSSTPGHLHPNYYWYNYPLEVSPSSWRNPLNHLLHKLHPDDVVTVKIDFDSPGLESAIVQTILSVPELYQTIDELFYEYHVRMAYMHRYWPTADNRVTVKDSIDLFRALRRRGIRAHSWV